MNYVLRMVTLPYLIDEMLFLEQVVQAALQVEIQVDQADLLSDGLAIKDPQFII
jgi:hypothetical protein